MPPEVPRDVVAPLLEQQEGVRAQQHQQINVIHEAVQLGLFAVGELFAARSRRELVQARALKHVELLAHDGPQLFVAERLQTCPQRPG